MRLERAEIHHICIPMHKPFITACGVIKERHLLIVELFSEGLVGLGECSANVDPHYNPETIKTCKYVLTDFLLPRVLRKNINSVEDLVKEMSGIVGNHMAKSALELAFWDLLSQQQEQPIYKLLGGTREKVAAGVSVGIFNSLNELLDEVDRQLAKGFQRLKVKIYPGHDYEIVKHLREQIGDFPLMVDANSSYSLNLLNNLKALDTFNLTQIEQPLEYDNILDHAKLQKIIHTPICLDESIVHARAARHAIELGSCRIINVKISRVGGLLEAKKIHDLCIKNRVGLWCGSMLESGIGMIYNIIFSSLPGINYPGDIQESGHYMIDDIVEPPISMTTKGFFKVPQIPGLGVRLNRSKLRQYLIDTQVIR